MPLSLPVRGRGGERLPLWRGVVMSFCYLSKSAIPKPLIIKHICKLADLQIKINFYSMLYFLR